MARKNRNTGMVTPDGELPETPAPCIVDKPWGWEAWWAFSDRYVGKRIHVKAGCRLSLQYHVNKVETMMVEDGRGFLEINGARRVFNRGMVQHIPAGVVHRLIAVTDLTITEVSTPEVADVVRLEDDYKRVEDGDG